MQHSSLSRCLSLLLSRVCSRPIHHIVLYFSIYLLLSLVLARLVDLSVSSFVLSSHSKRQGEQPLMGF